VQDISPAGADVSVLHALRCIGFTTAGRIAEATGVAEPEVESELIDLAVAGLVTTAGGPFRGWGLTEAGRAADTERCAAELDRAGTRAALAAAYERFLVLNPELLDLCTAWQMRSADGFPAPNDHTDQAYDARVLGRLADLHERATAVCADLSAALGRFRAYPPRLAGALARATAGERDYVADNFSSYHVVWFQLHEDLLVTLGIPRH
jgi:hypothetical protein